MRDSNHYEKLLACANIAHKLAKTNLSYINFTLMDNSGKVRKKLKKIAIYGKGGIGKSTTTSNLAAALSERYKVMQIGCDPKADSTINLMGGHKIPQVLDVCREKGQDFSLDEIVFSGYNGILCVESGGPIPGVGCAGLGIISAFQQLERLHAFEIYKPDIVLYDVLGDVVCGGFAMPIRDGYAEDIFIVTSGEKMALYAAYNIFSAVKQYEKRGYAACSGLILNKRNVEREEALTQELAEEIGSSIRYTLPRDGIVQKAEAQGKTVLEAFPDSDMAAHYRALASEVISSCDRHAKERMGAVVGKSLPRRRV